MWITSPHPLCVIYYGIIYVNHRKESLLFGKLGFVGTQDDVRTVGRGYIPAGQYRRGADIVSGKIAELRNEPA